MSITVNTNMSSIIAQRSLYKATNKMNTALERLSTGLRINSSKDDAAGSAISTKLEYKMSSYDVAKDNAQMGQSMLDTANGTLSNINSMLQRMRDLSEQASNGTYGEDKRKAMQAEIDGLTEEIYRIKNTTEFNGKKILGEEERQGLTSVPTMSMTDIDVENLTQAEWNKKYKGQIIGISNAKELQKLATIVNDKKIPTTGTTFALTADIDLDELGDIDGNGSNWTPIGGNWPNLNFNGIFNGNGYTIANLKINRPNSNFQGLFGGSTYGHIRNLNLENVNILGENYIGSIAAHGKATIDNCKIFGTIKGSSVVGGIIGEASAYAKISNCISELDLQGSTIGGIAGQSYGTGDITIENCYINGALVSLTNTPGLIIGNIGNLNGTTTNIINCSYNKEKTGDLPPVGKKPTGVYDVFDSKTNPFIPQEMQLKTNLQVGINSDNNSVISVDTGFSLDDFNVSVLSEFSARNSLDKIDAMMNKITAKMTEIGSVQNRLESTMEFQEVQRQALTSANSLIKDADIAKESANYVKNQILQNVTSTLLATANQNPSIALQLI